MTRLDSAMARHEKVHMFVETRTIDGIELSGLHAYTARAMTLFGKLNRFGRVAIVADQAWIRLASRLVSAMFQFISYSGFVYFQLVMEPEKDKETCREIGGQKVYITVPTE